MGSVYSTGPLSMLSSSCWVYNHSTVKLLVFSALVSKIRMVQALVPRLFAQGTWDFKSFYIFLMIMTSSQTGDL